MMGGLVIETNENIFKESGKNSPQSVNQESGMRYSEHEFFGDYDLGSKKRNFWPIKLTNFTCMFLAKDFAGHDLNFSEIIEIYRRTTFDKDFKPRVCKVA